MREGKPWHETTLANWFVVRIAARDTRSVTGYCQRCLGNGTSSMPSEQKGRSARSSKTLGGTAELNTTSEEDD